MDVVVPGGTHVATQLCALLLYNEFMQHEILQESILNLAKINKFFPINVETINTSNSREYICSNKKLVYENEP